MERRKGKRADAAKAKGLSGVDGTGARCEREQLRKVAAVQRKIVDLTRTHHSAEFGGRTFDGRRFRDNVHGLFRGTDLQTEIQNRRLADGERKVLLSRRLKALLGNAEIVGTGLNVDEYVFAGVVAERRLFDSGSAIAQREGSRGDTRSRAVSDNALDRRGGDLSQ